MKIKENYCTFVESQCGALQSFADHNKIVFGLLFPMAILFWSADDLPLIFLMTDCIRAVTGLHNGHFWSIDRLLYAQLVLYWELSTRAAYCRILFRGDNRPGHKYNWELSNKPSPWVSFYKIVTRESLFLENLPWIFVAHLSLLLNEILDEFVQFLCLEIATVVLGK